MAKGCEYIIISKNEDLNDLRFEVQKKEKRQLVLILLGELTGKIDINLKLAEKSLSEIYVATLLSGKSDLCINYVSNHVGDESRSNFSLYGSLDDNARKKTSMKIIFNRGASNAIGNECERVTLLSKDSQNISLPIIESYEESALGTHSSSTGHFDEEQIKYLMARGISRTRARILLNHSGLLNFLRPIKDGDVVEYILRKVKNETR